MDTVMDYLKNKTGLPVILDPQPVNSAEPHLRLTFTGATDKGPNDDELDFQLSIVGAGDGPDIFLPEIIQASLAVSDLFRGPEEENKGYVDLTFTDDDNLSHNIRLYFVDEVSNTGQFIQSSEDGEVQAWAYVYTEPHVIQVSFKSALRRGV